MGGKMAGMTTVWCKVYSTPDRVLAEILHGMLESNGIACSLVNRQDSNYIFLGEMELHVPADRVKDASDLIREALDHRTEN
jgi:hypothetical protein